MQAKSSIVDPPRLPSFPHSINNCLAPGGHFIVILAAMAVTSFTSLLQAFVFGLWLYINVYFDYKKNRETLLMDALLSVLLFLVAKGSVRCF